MDKLTSLRAERRRREVRREKFTHVNCTLPTIHLAPGPSDDDDDGEVNNEAIVRCVRSTLVSRARTLEISADLTESAMDHW